MNALRELRELRTAHPLTELLEIMTVYEGIKSCARLMVDGSRMEPLVEFARSAKLAIETSDFKLCPITDSGKGNFANKCIKVPPDAPKGRFSVYISQSIRQARAAKAAESFGHGDFGEILGYPNCCIDFFGKHIEEQRKRQMDFVIPAICSTNPATFHTNVALRIFGMALISHFPCSLQCPSSIDLGKKIWMCFGKYFPDAVSRWKYALKSFVIYTEFKGVFFMPGYIRKNDTISYSEFHASFKNELFDTLSCQDKLDIDGVHRISIEGLPIEDPDMVLMAFV